MRGRKGRQSLIDYNRRNNLVRNHRASWLLDSPNARTDVDTAWLKSGLPITPTM